MLRIAAIGCGRRVASMLALFIRNHPDMALAAVADPNQDIARQRLTEYKTPFEKTVFYRDADALLADAEKFDGFIIGTRCHLHTPMAVKVAATGKPLFLEKPVAISHEQLQELRDAWRGREKQVVVSFPLRLTSVFRIAQEYLAAGKLGVVNQIQAFNNVSYGDVYYASWYRRFPEVGGLWLQKATHDFDYLNLLVGARPLRVAAMMTRRIFGTGRRLEPDHCDYYERIDPAKNHEDITDASATLEDEGNRFHAAIRNQDAGSALLWYENGVLVSYDQNFVSRKAAGRRGAIITGFNGTVEFDWREPIKLRYVDHHSNRVDHVDAPAVGGHGGGDDQLAQAFHDLMAHGTPSPVDLTAGLQSVSMCLAARQAARTHTVQPIVDMGALPPCQPFDLSKVEAQ